MMMKAAAFCTKQNKKINHPTSRKNIFERTRFIILEINIQLMATDAIYQFNLMMLIEMHSEDALAPP